MIINYNYYLKIMKLKENSMNFIGVSKWFILLAFFPVFGRAND
jgi:hypothetical protein